jgi:N-acetylglucosamine-6-phosphate deacetylase
LVDAQVNGYAGVDFNADPAGWTGEAFHTVRSAMRARGVVAAAVTFVTAEPDRLVARARRWAELVDADEDLARFFPRLHLEGPFLSPVTGPRGAHRLECCTTPLAQPDLVDRFQDACGGRLALLTLAPEVDGALAEIARWARRGVCVSIGHTQATGEQVDRAVEAGARMSTHLGNGSGQVLPRVDNYVQYQLACDALHAGLIADGQHMPLTTLKNFIRAKTPARSVLVTDAILAAEMPPGRYESCGRPIEVTAAGRVQVPGEANLAGSALTLDRAVLNVARHCGVPWEQAWAMASTQPAELLGLGTPPEVTVTVEADRFRLQE